MGCSRFARHYSGNRSALSVPPLTEMFHFSGYGSYGPIEFRPLYSDITRSGFPHSEIHGSKRECRSPWLIATYYVLHRLSSPRHPPCALSSLITNYPSGSLLQEFQTEYSQLVVVFTHYTVCNCQRTLPRLCGAKCKSFIPTRSSETQTVRRILLAVGPVLQLPVGTGGRDRIRTYDPALIKRML